MRQTERIGRDPGDHHARQVPQRIGVVDAVVLGDVRRQSFLGLLAHGLGDGVHQRLGGHVLRDGTGQLAGGRESETPGYPMRHCFWRYTQRFTASAVSFGLVLKQIRAAGACS